MPPATLPLPTPQDFHKVQELDQNEQRPRTCTMGFRTIHATKEAAATINANNIKLQGSELLPPAPVTLTGVKEV